MNYKLLIAELIEDQLQFNFKEIYDSIQIPPTPSMGDFCFPCFVLARITAKPPNLLALDLQKKISAKPFERIEAVGAYLNFYVDKKIYVNSLLRKVIQEGDMYGNSNIGEGKRVVLQCSLVDSKGSSYIEHLRSMLIADSINRMLSFYGYSCISIRYSNYSYEFLEKLCNKFDLKYDSYDSEEQYTDKIEITEMLLNNNERIKNYNGGLIFLLDEDFLPPLVIKNSKGFSSRFLKQLAFLITKYNLYNYDKIICFDLEMETTNYKKLFNVLKLTDNNWYNSCTHAPTGNVKFIDKKLSIKKYGLSFIFEILDETSKILSKFFPDLNLTSNSKESIAINSIKFELLKCDSTSSILFKVNDMINSNAQNYLYIQLVYLRWLNFLKKEHRHNRNYNSNFTVSYILSEAYISVKLIGNFNKYIEESIKKNDPSILTAYLIRLTVEFDRVCTKFSKQDIGVNHLISIYIRVVCQVIRNCLNLLGIKIICIK